MVSELRSKLKKRQGKNGYDLEDYILRAIDDLTLETQRVMSRHELAERVGNQENQFDVLLSVFTLEGKGFIAMSETGYILTAKGRENYKTKIKLK